MKNVIEKINGLLENNDVTITEENNTVFITANGRLEHISIDSKMSSMDIIFRVIDTVKELKLFSDIELVEKNTECTKEQAEYLVKELSKFPKVYNVFLNNLKDINLCNCESVEVARLYGYMRDDLNVVAKRLNTVDIGNGCYPHYNTYIYAVSSILNEIL